MKILILSRYQNTTLRGVETFVQVLTSRFGKDIEFTVLSGKDSDSLKKIISGKYDVVMPMNGRMQSLKASFGRLFSGYKLVIGGHSGIGRDDIWNIFVCRPDIFIALTDYMANWAKKWALGSKVIKIPNGVDMKKFSPVGPKADIDLPSPLILSVGALEWYKGHEKTIDAVSKLDKGSLLIIGDGSQKDFLQKLGKEKLGNRFKILKAPYEDLPKIYRAADIFTLPSWDREAFGIVYLEAMASGLGVVAPDDLSRREIVGESGIYVDVSDPKLFAQAISKALNVKWGDKPVLQAEKFSWVKIAKEYLNCFRNI
jgi:glycosyltransferase involved in cell wall biosynthesis